MGSRKHVLVFLLMIVVAEVVSASAESGNSIANATKVTSRSGRKDHVIYSQPDEYVAQKQAQKQNAFYSPDESDEELPSGFKPSVERLSKDGATPPYSFPTYEEYVTQSYDLPQPHPRYYAPGPMYKSGSSVNWNVWKGNPADNAQATPAPAPQMAKGPPQPDFSEYYYPADTWKGDTWKGDPWTPDQMSSMLMLMNQMQAANKPKFGGFLSRLTQDPVVFLVAAILPFSILLAAVLPTLVNMMMNGGLPTITTTATGNTGRDLDGTEFLSPMLTTITTFGARAFENPDCMQRIFCQVTKGPKGNGTDARTFQRSLYSASRLIDSHWLETFGVKTLFDSMANGDCEKIPCSHTPTSKSSVKKDNTKT